MSKITDIIRDIEQQQLGATNRRVLLVEGVDDVHAVESFLNKTFPSWARDWVVESAGKKGHVLEVIKQKADWIGIVDSDEWTQQVIIQKQLENDNLWVLPRYCIENYLLIPEELWAAFPPNQKAKVDGGLEKLKQRMTDDLDKWVCHGVLWTVINPLWEGLRSLGFKEALLDLEISGNDQQIKQKLVEWHDYLEPDSLYQTYQNKLAKVQSLASDEKLKHWVHGKKFYGIKVNQVLNDLLGQIPANDRKKAIFRTCEVPRDFEPLWKKMGLTGVNNK